jgi:hypothetical protein
LQSDGGHYLNRPPAHGLPGNLGYNFFNINAVLRAFKKATNPGLGSFECFKLMCLARFLAYIGLLQYTHLFLSMMHLDLG